MKLEKIKLVNVVDEKMTKGALKLILGGSGGPGCDNNVCGGGMTVAAGSSYCTDSGCAVCSSSQGN